MITIGSFFFLMRFKGCLVVEYTYCFDLLLTLKPFRLLLSLEKYSGGGVHWRDQSIRVRQVQRIAFSAFVTAVFLPHQGIVAYDAANLPSLADAASLSVSSSDLDIAMVNFLLRVETLKQRSASMAVPSEWNFSSRKPSCSLTKLAPV